MQCSQVDAGFLTKKITVSYMNIPTEKSVLFAHFPGGNNWGTGDIIYTRMTTVKMNVHHSFQRSERVEFNVPPDTTFFRWFSTELRQQLPEIK